MSSFAQAPAGTGTGADTNSMKLLRQTIADQKRFPDKVIRTYTNVPPEHAQPVSPASIAPPDVPVFKPEPAPAALSTPHAAAAAALERQFLDGKLSARQYQKALADLDRPNSAPPKTTSNPKLPPAPAPSGPAAAVPGRQQKVSDVEARIDEMIRQKEAREKAAQTNAVTAPAGVQTKRQRLDFLLRQVVEGKLSDEEYKKQREKILSEPD
ncbi:MAG: hypothetical protein QOF48_1130 [Verrucomicrobiota bacterium]